MALRAVPDHPKFAVLKSILGLPKGAALGWLETMWHFCGRFTPQGNIGKYPDAMIESWVEWDGKPGDLIAAFVQAGWIDTDPVHRLLVHDWAQHADKATKNALTRAKKAFCSPGVRTGGEHVAQNESDLGTVYGLPVPEPVPEPEEKTIPPAHEPFAFDADPLDTIPDDAPPMQCAALVLETCDILPAPHLIRKFGDGIKLLRKAERVGIPDATRRMVERVRAAQAQGESKWAFWLEDDGWKLPVARASPASVGVWDGKPWSGTEEPKPMSEIMGAEWCRQAMEASEPNELQRKYLREEVYAKT